MISNEQIQDVMSSTAIDRDGDKIGKVGQVYLDDRTNEPAWATVNTGLFGTNESFVPLSGATVEGGNVRLNVTKDRVKDAPNVAADGHLDPSEEEQLYRHYGLDFGMGDDITDRDVSTDDMATSGMAAGTMTEERGTVGHDTSGPTTDEAMTRSEEQLRVGTETREAGRARLRKYVTTEEQSVTVPVTREEVRVEREPITDGNVGEAMDGPAISEEEHEVVLHEERPVVGTEAVPVERVRLDTETVTEQEQVSGEVRKEQIETEGVDVRGTGTSDRTGR